MPSVQNCAYCSVPIIGKEEYSIHRDGFGIGPEVPLCLGCAGPELSCEVIWDKISLRDAAHRERLGAITASAFHAESREALGKIGDKVRTEIEDLQQVLRLVDALSAERTQ